MKKTAVKTGPSPMNLPFTPGIRYGNLVFISAQGPVDQEGHVLQGDITAQTRATLENMGRVLAAAGSGLEHVLQTTVYLKDLDEYSAMNDAYAESFPEPRPARTTVQANLLWGMRVEIQGIAYVPVKTRK